jgi:hypothetical protein
MEISIGPANLAISLYSFRNARGSNQAITLRFFMLTIYSKQPGPMQKGEAFNKFCTFKIVEDILFVDKHLVTYYIVNSPMP